PRPLAPSRLDPSMALPTRAPRFDARRYLDHHGQRSKPEGPGARSSRDEGEGRGRAHLAPALVPSAPARGRIGITRGVEPGAPVLALPGGLRPAQGDRD